MPRSLKLILEALLFASEKPLTPKDIQGVLPDVKLPDIKGALKVLKYEYEAMGRSFGLKEIADGFQFRSHSEYGSYILAMLQTSPSRISRAALETLAIIAYKQPIIRQEIERLRGVDVGGSLKTLLEKDLIKIMGRKSLPGRPLIYGTTKRFLEVFDLKDIDSLPKLKEIKALGTDAYEAQPLFEKTHPEGPPDEQDQERSPDSEVQGAGPGTVSNEEQGDYEDKPDPLPGGPDIETQGR